MENSYYRVECIDTETEICQGGYICTIDLMLSIILGIKPGQEEALAEAMEKSDDTRVTELKTMILCLADIPVPEVYETDKSKYICLYTEEEFFEVVDCLAELSDLLEEITKGRYTLNYKRFDCIMDEDIVYEDLFQIVMKREKYEKIAHYFLYRDLEIALAIFEERMGENPCDDEF